MRDPEKARARRCRYALAKKIKKYGPEAAAIDMRGRHRHNLKGSDHPRWNNGVMRTSQGYVAVAVPEGHHLRMAHGYAYQHDLVAEEMLGRRLRDGEVVHHRNGKRDDNRHENLEVTTRSNHARRHALERHRGEVIHDPAHPEWPAWGVREFPHV